MLDPAKEHACQEVDGDFLFWCRNVMNIVSSAVSLTVADPVASSRFFSDHLGFRESLVGERFIGLGRDDAAVDLVLVERDLERWRPGQGPAEAIVVFAVTGLAAEYERLRAEGAAVTLTVTVPTGRRRVSGGVRTVTPRYQGGWRWWTHERSGHRGLGAANRTTPNSPPPPVRRSWKP